MLDSSQQDLLPFCLHTVDLQGDVVICAISAMSPANVQTGGGKGKEKASYVFMLVKVPLAGHETPQQFLPTITLHGSDIPQLVVLKQDQCIVGATCGYRTDAGFAPPAEEQAAPADAESVGIPQAVSSVETTSSSPPPPFSWTQDTETVTVVFPLPSTTVAKNVKVVFMPSAISLQISGDEVGDARQLPVLSGIKLWDAIDAGTSTWTWEKVGGDKGRYGILSLHLEKKHEGTRWTSLFKAASDGNEAVEARYLQVEETLDRSELIQITEALEKYTSDQTSGVGSGMAGFEAKSSLLGEEFDADVDSDERQSGKSLDLTEIEGVKGDAPQCVHNAKAEAADMVSVPLPSVSAEGSSSSIIVKHDVDGLLFEIFDAGWKHTSTYPALSFILASKRDVVQVYHHQDKLCIGLESGSPVGGQSGNAGRSYSSFGGAKMNAYLYYPPPPGSKAKSAKQKVVGLADSSAGAVIGAAAIQRDARLDIAVLCEREVVVLHDVLR